jgi:hypothetical protein
MGQKGQMFAVGQGQSLAHGFQMHGLLGYEGGKKPHEKPRIAPGLGQQFAPVQDIGQLGRPRSGGCGRRLGLYPGSTDGPGQGCFQVGRADGLAQIFVHSGPQKGLAVALEGMGGQGHDRNGRVEIPALIGPDGPGGFQTVHFRHLDIHEDDVEALFA